jgi:hypothetical protein
LPIMYRHYQAVTLGKDHPEKVNHGNLNEVWPGKKGKDTEPYYYQQQCPNPESSDVR